MELPHAAEIRRLRALVERAHRARGDLSDLEPALTVLSLGSGNERAESLLAHLRQSWPEFDLEGECHQGLSKARLQLQTAVIEGEQQQTRLHRLQHHQWDELQKEEWADVLQELNALAAERASIAASLQPLHQIVSSLQPVLDVLGVQLAEARADLDAGHEDRALRRLHSCHAALVAALAQHQLQVAVDKPEGGAQLADAVDEAMERVQDILTHMLEERDALRVKVSAIEARSQARTG